MTPSLSLRQLRYLVALHTEPHFGRAAETLGVGQSTLSAGIAELERLVGVRLVERTKRSVRFTALGENFVARARLLVEAGLELAEFAAAAAAPLAGPVRLGIIPTLAPFLLPKVMGAVKARFPALELVLREQTSPRLCADLHRGALDCVLLALPFECGRVETADIVREPLFLAVPAGREALPLESHKLLLLEDGHCLNEHGLTACGLARDRAVGMVASSLHTLLALVDAGLGATFLPALALAGGILDGRRVTALPLGANAERRIVLAWRKDSARGEDYRLLAHLLADVASG